jgi:hypothetical protein
MQTLLFVLFVVRKGRGLTVVNGVVSVVKFVSVNTR